MAEEKDKEDRPTGTMQRKSYNLQKVALIYQGIAIVIAIGIFYWSISSTLASSEKNTKLLETAQKSLDAQTRPPFLIMELQPERSGNQFNDDGTYLIAGPENERQDSVRINLWNTGAQVAENVTVSLKFSPSNGDLVDTMTMKKCRDIVCNTSPDGAANMVKIRAIEAGGFYTVVANYRIFPQAIANMTEPLNMTFTVENPIGKQTITQMYRVDIGG